MSCCNRHGGGIGSQASKIQRSVHRDKFLVGSMMCCFKHGGGIGRRQARWRNRPDARRIQRNAYRDNGSPLVGEPCCAAIGTVAGWALDTAHTEITGSHFFGTHVVLL
eukprot:1032046-Pyramimonas_sp.AAC.1